MNPTCIHKIYQLKNTEICKCDKIHRNSNTRCVYTHTSSLNQHENKHSENAQRATQEYQVYDVFTYINNDIISCQLDHIVIQDTVVQQKTTVSFQDIPAPTNCQIITSYRIQLSNIKQRYHFRTFQHPLINVQHDSTMLRNSSAVATQQIFLNAGIMQIFQHPNAGIH